MKMPEKHDLLAAILAAKEQHLHLCVLMAYLRGRYNGGCVYKKTVIDATMYAPLSPSSFVTFDCRTK